MNLLGLLLGRQGPLGPLDLPLVNLLAMNLLGQRVQQIESIKKVDWLGYGDEKSKRP